MAEFLAVAGAHFLALLSPGPDFFIIISAAVRNGVKKAVYTCAGIAAANGVYILTAVFGFSLVQKNMWFLGVMKAAGACFLCWVGFMLLRAGKRELFTDEKDISADTPGRLFGAGFMSAILNPKNPIFYMSLYSLFLSGDTGLDKQLAYGLWMFSAVLLWDIFVAFSVGNRKIRSIMGSYTHRIERFSGAVIILLGILIVLQ